MKVYKVMFENNTAISAMPTQDLQHCDIGMNTDNNIVQWLSLECENEKTAIEVANKVAKTMWGKGTV